MLWCNGNFAYKIVREEHVWVCNKKFTYEMARKKMVVALMFYKM